MGMEIKNAAQEASDKEIIRLRKQGKTRPEIVTSLNKGGYKTPMGLSWTKTNVGNRILRLGEKGLVKVMAGNNQHTKTQTVKAPVKTVALKSKGKTETRYMTAMLRIPVEINLGTAEFRVLSLDK